MRKFTVKEVIDIVRKMDPAEADAMGVSCRMFAHVLEEKLRESEPPRRGDGEGS